MNILPAMGILPEVVNANTHVPWWHLHGPTNAAEWLYVISLIVTMVSLLTLIIFPRQSWANFWLCGLIVPLLLSILYTFVLFIGFFQPVYFPPETYLYAYSNP